jgi:hypothetical protein
MPQFRLTNKNEGATNLLAFSSVFLRFALGFSFLSAVAGLACHQVGEAKVLKRECVIPALGACSGAAVGAAAGAAVGTIVGVLVGDGLKKVLLYESGAAVPVH